MQSIWDQTQIGDPVYDGLTLGGIEPIASLPGGNFVKANYPGLRAIRVGDTVTLRDALADSVPIAATPAGTSMVKARASSLAGGTMGAAAVKLTAALAIPAAWGGYDLEATYWGICVETGTLTAVRSLVNQLRLTNATGTLISSAGDLQLGTDVPDNRVPVGIGGYLTGQTATGTVNVVYVNSIPADTGQVTWRDATLIATAFRTDTPSTPTSVVELLY
jgi:hypothetical protein